LSHAAGKRADLVIGDGQLALQIGIVGIVLGEPLLDREALLVGFRRTRQVALRRQHVADLVVRARQVIEPG
jgi:hypothetical protein